MRLLSAQEAAKSLGVSVADIQKLVSQGILHPVKQEASNLFSFSEINRITSGSKPSLSEEAEQVGIQIQRDVVTSVSGLKKYRKRSAILATTIPATALLLVTSVAALFMAYPDKTSDYFGYYYRYNVTAKVSSEPNTPSRVLAATTEPQPVSPRTSIVADVLKPFATASLLIVKSIDSQRYQEIVTNPTSLPTAQSQTTTTGPAGPPGPQGEAGPAGAALSSATPTIGALLLGDGSSWLTQAISGLTNASLSGSAGITNANLANSALTIDSGSGLTGGGLMSLGESVTLNIGSGNGIAVNDDEISINLAASGTTGLDSSRSGLELTSTGLSLLLGCNNNEILKWMDASGWVCSKDASGSDLQHGYARDTNESMTNVASSQVALGSLSITPATTTADIYLTAHADVFSSNSTDQPFTLTIETTNNCSGSTVGNATVTYTITSGASNANNRGVLMISGVAINPGTGSQSYSLCASTSAGDTNVMNWNIEALVIDTGGT